MDGAGTTAVTPESVNRMLDEGFPGTGNTCVEVGPAHALARREVDQWSVRPGGFVSGPTQFALADAVVRAADLGSSSSRIPPEENVMSVMPHHFRRSVPRVLQLTPHVLREP